MSDNENEDSGKEFCIERAKQGRAKCKKCKQQCLSGELRIAKLAFNPFGDGKMKVWHHVDCIFQQFLSQRITTKRIEDPDDIDGWDNLNDDDKNEILRCIEMSEKDIKNKYGDKYVAKEKPIQTKASKKETTAKKNVQKQKASDTVDKTVSDTKYKDHKDNLFREFRRLVAEVTNENSYLEKTAIIKNLFTKGSDGDSFKGNLLQWCQLLLPGVIKRIYNLQSKQLVKLFANIFATNREEMLEHLEQGDVSETIKHFFENNDEIKPSKKSPLTMDDVDDFLEELSRRTKEDEQVEHFKKIIKKCTGNDLKIIIRLIKHDLRMNAGAKHVLDAVHSDAYEAFQSSRNLSAVLKRISETSSSQSVEATIDVMTPVLPMLAEACKSVEQAMKKCPNGMYSEIKYDGERVQVHKLGSEFKYFSRSLKPVMPHKVNHFKEYIPRAFPHGHDLILDSEVLLIDNTTGKPLPFGSLGKHKKEEFKNANVCLFVFDCIYFNGETLTHKPIKERKRILQDNMTEIPNHIVFSEMKQVSRADDLTAMIKKVLQLGLEGLVLKDMMSIYEPGKRHWLKVKKDYLCDGAMADTADLIVLGAWYGTGKKGGMMSVFLMGCYHNYLNKFCTVTKVHTGHDDKTLEQLQSELDMIKISADASKVPDWLKCTKTMVPDFVARNPKKQPVWEITGAEFTQQHDVHTANGISIRFPRVTRIRDDKDWKTATNVQELETLFKKSKENTDFSLLKTEIKSDDEDEPGTSDIKTKNTKRENQAAGNKSPKKIKVNTDLKTEIKSENESDGDEPQTSDIKTKNTKRKNQEVEHKSPKKIKNNSVNIKAEPSSKKIHPVIFHNVKLLPVENVDINHDNIIRHFIAAGGDLIKPENWDSATHVVHENNYVNTIRDNYPCSAKHITIDWLQDSIAHSQIQDIKPYIVQWIPV